MTRGHLAVDRAGGHIEGRHQAGGAVALVVAGAGLGMAGLHRQGRLRPSQRLDLRLLVHRDDHGVVVRVDQRPTTSQTFNANLGSRETLNVLTLWGLRPWLFRMPNTLETAISTFVASARSVQ